MKAFALSPQDVRQDTVLGRILCQDVLAVGELGRKKLAKGRIIEPADVVILQHSGEEIHLLEMDSSAIHEDEASIRLASAIKGDGVEVREPIESQSLLRAAYRGLVEVKVEALEQINNLPDVSVFTVYDGQPVSRGKAVGATKVTPLAVPRSVIERAEAIAREAGPIVTVRSYTGGKVGVVVRERLAGKGGGTFESAINMKVGWFGSRVAGIRYVTDNVPDIADALDFFLAEGVSLILAAGVNSTDPLDLTIQALEKVGARTEKRGVPAHPGSTCWLSYAGDVPIFGLALCGMFSQTTVLDLLLPRFLAGRKVCAADLAGLGHGGLLGKEMAFRFPDYAMESGNTG